MKEKTILKGILLAIIVTVIWSGNFIVARAIYKDISPVKLAFFRWSTATIILLPFALKAVRQDWSIITTNIRYLFWLALSGVCLFNTFIYVGGHYTSAMNLALIGTTSSPIMSNILARIFLKEKIGFYKITGMIFCVFGILFLLSKGDPQNLLHLQFSRGDAWVLLAALAFAVYNVLVRKKPAGLSALSFLFSGFALGTLLLIPLIFMEGDFFPPTNWSLSLIEVILYLGLGASVICYLLWNQSIQILGAGRASLFGNLIPIFSSLEAVLILHEQFTVNHIISMILVFTGLIIANIPLLRAGTPVIVKS